MVSARMRHGWWSDVAEESCEAFVHTLKKPVETVAQQLGSRIAMVASSMAAKFKSNDFDVMMSAFCCGRPRLSEMSLPISAESMRHVISSLV